MSAAGSTRHNDREGSPKRRRRRSPSSSHGNFLSRYIASRKVNKVLGDIQEAKHYGIELQNISLRELYYALQDAREKEEAHKVNHPGQPFYYDSGEHTQLPSDGLDQLANRMHRDHEIEKGRRPGAATPVLRKQRSLKGTT